MSVKEFSNVSNYFESSIQLANIFQLKSHCDWAILVCTGAFFTFFIFSIRLFSALTLKSVLRCRISCSHWSFLQSSNCRAVCGFVPSIVGAHHFQNTYGPSRDSYSKKSPRKATSLECGGTNVSAKDGNVSWARSSALFVQVQCCFFPLPYRIAKSVVIGIGVSFCWMKISHCWISTSPTCCTRGPVRSGRILVR